MRNTWVWSSRLGSGRERWAWMVAEEAEEDEAAEEAEAEEEEEMGLT